LVAYSLLGGLLLHGFILGDSPWSSAIDKLTREKHLLWKAQVLPALRGAHVMELLDGSDSAPTKTMEVKDENKKKMTIPNPAY
jgi:hypothetical protein